MSDKQPSFMIYGANGYTGELIAREAKYRGLNPVLAGRSDEVRILAEELGLSHRIFPLDNHEHLVEMLQEISLVLHCAGPFSATAKPMLDACIQSKTHYLDITGELSIFELARSYDAKARESGITIIPGVGFDVVPTDCLAVFLKDLLPDAKYLEMGYYGKGARSSRGTFKTGVEGLKQGFFIRENGQLKQVPMAHRSKDIDFGLGESMVRTCMSVPWGDLSTAYSSTGIENIEFFVAYHPRQIRFFKRMNRFRFIYKSGLVQKLIKGKAKSMPAGPSEEERKTAITYIWGQVRNGKKMIEAKMITPNGYDLTVNAALLLVQKVLNNPPTGYQTPAMAFGYQLLDELGIIPPKIKQK